MDWNDQIMENSLKNRAGSSIIEILITLVIITIITALTISFSRSSFNIMSDTRAKDTAYLAAEEKLTDLSTKAFPVASSTPETITVDNITMYRSWTIDKVNTIKRARVTVSYLVGGKTSSIILSGAIN
jgi:type II secretory pathway pseudopilin PulG